VTSSDQDRTVYCRMLARLVAALAAAVMSGFIPVRQAQPDQRRS
jgi:hypothetical protein